MESKIPLSNRLQVRIGIANHNQKVISQDFSKVDICMHQNQNRPTQRNHVNLF